MSEVANYPIYDADQHYYETPDAFLRYLPKKYRHAFQYVQVAGGRTKLAINGQLSEYIPNPTFNVVAGPGVHEQWYRGRNEQGLSFRELTGTPVPSHPSFNNGPAHLANLDEQGVHGAILLPTLASVIEERMGHDGELIMALMHSLNGWVKDEYGFRNGRQFPTAAINLVDMDAAVKELEIVLAEGARSVLIRPAPVAGLRGSRSHGAKEFDPFWARVSEAGIFVIHHVSDSGYDRVYRMWTGGITGEFRPFEKDPFKEALDAMGRAAADSMAALICHGTFDRHPNLRVVSLEQGSSWVGPLLDRLHMAYRKLPQEFQQDPVEAFKRHVYVAPFYEDDVKLLADRIGTERIIFGSDWPHPEGLGRPLDFFNDIDELSPAQVQRIMSTNLKDLLAGVRD